MIKIVKGGGKRIEPKAVVPPPEPKAPAPVPLSNRYKTGCEWCGHPIISGCTADSHRRCLKYHTLRRKPAGSR